MSQNFEFFLTVLKNLVKILSFLEFPFFAELSKVSITIKWSLESEPELIISCPRTKALKTNVAGEGLQSGHTPLAGGLETFLIGSFVFVVNF